MAKQHCSHLGMAPQQRPEDHGIAQSHGIEPGTSSSDWRMMEGKQGWSRWKLIQLMIEPASLRVTESTVRMAAPVAGQTHDPPLSKLQYTPDAPIANPQCSAHACGMVVVAGQRQDWAAQETQPGLQPQVGTCIARIRQITRQQQQIRTEYQHTRQDFFQRLIGIPAGNNFTGLGGEMEIRQMSYTQQMQTPGITHSAERGLLPEISPGGIVVFQ